MIPLVGSTPSSAAPPSPPTPRPDAVSTASGFDQVLAAADAMAPADSAAGPKLPDGWVMVQVSTACACAACLSAATAGTTTDMGGVGSPSIDDGSQPLTTARSPMLDQADRYLLRSMQISVASMLLDRPSVET